MEAMRLDPSFPMTDMLELKADVEIKLRSETKEFQKKSKLILAKGTCFQINTAAMHRDVTQW